MLVDQIKATHATLGMALSNEDFERAILLLRVLKELLQARKLEIELEKLEPPFDMLFPDFFMTRRIDK